MTKDNLISMQSEFQDDLNEVMRHGARKLLAQAIGEEVQELLDTHADRRTPAGRNGVVRSGAINRRGGCRPASVRWRSGSRRCVPGPARR